MRNTNGKIIRKLSMRSMKKSRMRNAFAVAAIALTGLLFTALFSMGIGISQMLEEETMREVGTRAHAGLKAVTMEQYEEISANPKVVSSSWNIYLGNAENLSRVQGEIRVAGSGEELENSFITLSEGRLPEKENELAADTLVLEELGVPAAVGEQLHVEFTFHGERLGRDFTLCGWYEGSRIGHASTLYVSEAFWESVRGGQSWEELKEWDQKHPENNHAGTVAGNLFFKNARNIEENVREVISEAGYIPETDAALQEEKSGDKEIAYGVNWAYLSNRAEGIDPLAAALLAFAFFVILLTGYLIIYNIFQLSIIGDIRFYGLLKTVGATKRQLRRMVYRQAFFLCIPGIPTGILLGAAAGKLLLPLAIQMAKGSMEASVRLSPWIFALGAAFSFLTVCISCRRPARIAGEISPVEAVRFTEGSGVRKKERKSEKGAKIRRMAFANLGRNRKKTAVVIGSISLSIILLALVMSAVRSFRMDEYLESRITGDFELGNQGFTNTGALVADLEVSEEYLSGADCQPGIEETGEIWKGEYYHTLSAKGYERYQSFYEEGKLRLLDEELILAESEVQPDEIAQYHFPIAESRYAYTDNLLERLVPVKGEIDPEKFQAGGYVLVEEQQNTGLSEPGDSFYKPGDKITLEYRTEESEFFTEKSPAGHYIMGYTDTVRKEYTVMAVVEHLPYSMSSPLKKMNCLTTIVPLADLEGDPGAQLLAKSYWVKDEKQEAFENWLKAYTQETDPEMGYLSKPVLMGEFEGMIGGISMVGYTLCAVIALIGILNFANSMLTGIVSRRQEFAVLQSVGMTRGQLRKMLLWESACYLIICAAISIPAGSLLSWKIIGALNGVINCFSYSYTALPYALMLPAVALLAAVISLGACRQVEKRSIVERLREAE